MIEAKDTGEVAKVVTPPEAAPPAEATEEDTLEVVTVEQLQALPQYRYFFDITLEQLRKPNDLMKDAVTNLTNNMIPYIRDNIQEIQDLDYIHDLYYIFQEMADPLGLQLHPADKNGQINDTVFAKSRIESLKATGMNRESWLKAAAHITIVLYYAIRDSIKQREQGNISTYI